MHHSDQRARPPQASQAEGPYRLESVPLTLGSQHSPDTPPQALRMKRTEVFQQPDQFCLGACLQVYDDIPQRCALFHFHLVISRTRRTDELQQLLKCLLSQSNGVVQKLEKYSSEPEQAFRILVKSPTRHELFLQLFRQRRPPAARADSTKSPVFRSWSRLGRLRNAFWRTDTLRKLEPAS